MGRTLIWLVLASAATGALHAWSAGLEPSVVGGDDLDRMVGRPVRVDAVVDRVRATSRYVTLDAFVDGVPLRALVPPGVALQGAVPGSRLRLDGQLVHDGTGWLVHVDAIAREAADVPVVDVVVLAQEAPRSTGAFVRAVGDVQIEGAQVWLTSGSVRFVATGEPPPHAGHWLAAGVVRYDGAQARYLLDVAAWHPWPSPPF